MQSFSQHLVDLVLQGLVEPEIAAGASGNKHDFEIALAQALRARAAEENEDGGLVAKRTEASPTPLTAA